MPPELIVLDVAHGNCALVIGDDGAAVIDTPRGGIHIDALKHKSVHEVLAVVVSHADADHMSGVTHMLYDEGIRVHKVYVNTDATKTAGGAGLVWQNFVIALADAERRGETAVTGIKRGDSVYVQDDSIRLEVLAPSTELTLLGAGGTFDGRTLTSNSLSVVVRVWFAHQPIALLTGDLDEVGLVSLLREGDDLRAQVMVFPHHGGHSGGDNETFARQITSAVAPERVVFSFGREQHDNPRLEIVKGARGAKPDAQIACTELSKACSPANLDPGHVGDIPAQGRDLGRCCAGSLLFEESGMQVPVATDHSDFVTESVPTPMCVRLLE